MKVLFATRSALQIIITLGVFAHAFALAAAPIEATPSPKSPARTPIARTLPAAVPSAPEQPKAGESLHWDGLDGNNLNRKLGQMPSSHAPSQSFPAEVR